MKTLITQIGNDFIVSQVEDNHVLQSTQETQETFDKCPVEYIKPKIVRHKWVDTATAEEIATAQAKNREVKYVEIDTDITKLLSGSTALLLGLKGLTQVEIDARVALYNTLYEFCVDTNITSQNETLLKSKWQMYKVKSGEDITFAKYKSDVVIAKTLALRGAKASFDLMLENVRTFWKMSVSDEAKFLTIKQKLDALTLETDPSNIPALFAEIMAI